MSARVPPGAPYTNRRPDAVVLNTTLDRAAVAILHKYAPPGRKTTGRFLARLLYEHDARQQMPSSDPPAEVPT